MSEHVLSSGDRVPDVILKNKPAKDGIELLRRLRDQMTFLEGVSYALPEEAGRQLRRRVQNMLDNVVAFRKEKGEDV